MFITFEGPEGSGKSTQINLLENFLKEINKKFITIREPGGTTLGEEIRKILVSSEYDDMSSETELLLFISSRKELMEKIIKPALKDNQFVLCDRFIDSTIAYQGYGRGINLNKIQMLNEIAIEGIYPDLTFLLQLDVDSSLERLKSRYSNSEQKFDRIEKENKFFHQKIFDGYNEISKSSDRIIKINAMLPIDKISNIVKDKILELSASL